MVYNWTKRTGGTGLGDLSKNSFWRGAVSRPYTSKEEGATVNILCTHHQHLHLVTKAGFTMPLNLSPAGKALPLLLGLKLWGL